MGVLVAWLTAEGLVFYRQRKATGGPAMPGQILASSGVFAVLALVAGTEKGKFLGNAMAWGLTLATFMNLSEKITAGSGPLGSVGSAIASAVLASQPPAVAPAPQPANGLTPTGSANNTRFA